MRALRILTVLLCFQGVGLAKPAGPPPPVRRMAQRAVSAQCVLTEILATNDHKGIDPKLEKLKAKLARPPFSAWDTFKLLKEPTARADKDRAVTTALSTGGQVTILLKDKLVSQGGRPRLRVGVDMDAANGQRIVSTVVVFDSGESVLFGGEPYQNGTYILGLSCSSQ